MSMVKIDNWDISVLVIYFLSVILTGFIAMFASKRGTVSGFFLAGRFMTWLPIGASLFASNIGSEHFIGLAGSGAASGIGVGAFELNASLLLQLLGWVFLPVYIASGVCTLPEYMSRRFGGRRIQVYLAALSLTLYVFTKISVNLYSGSLFLIEALQWNIWVSVILLLGLTSLITITGGLAAVLYTDTLQFFVMIVGAILLCILSFIRVGGFEGLLTRYGGAIAHVDLTSIDGSNLLVAMANASLQYNTSSLSELASKPGVDPSLACSLPSTKAFRLLRGISDPDMPWLGFILGQTPASIWYWCADQMMVQRVLAAKSLSHAQGATIMAGLIKQLPIFIMVLPGMISRILYSDEVACIPGDQCFRVCGQRNGCSNLAYPKLVVGLMPSGLRGLMLAVMLAALISDLTSIFNSASTLFTVDIYRRFRKRAEESELMLVGRVFVLLLVGISIAWIPVIQQLQGSQLFIYIQAISAYLSPPIAAVYLIAVLWSRPNEKGAFYALAYGLVIGLTRMILSMIYTDPVCGEVDTRPWIIGQLHYMYFGMFSFMSTALVMVVVSLLCGTRPSPKQLSRLTYSTAWDPHLPAEQVYESCTEPEKFYDPSSGNGLTEFPLKPLNVGDVGEHEYNNNNSNKQTEAHPFCQLHQPDPGVSQDWIDHTKTPGTEVTALGECECAGRSRLGRCATHAARWMCGCEERPCPNEVEQGCLASLCCTKLNLINFNDKTTAKSVAEDSEHYAIRLQKITSLSQDPRAKLGLRIGLFLTIFISLFGFTFFSVYFDPVIPGPVPIYLPQNTSLAEDVTQALDRLSQLRVVHLL